jgi:tRNA (guanine37-N1)-methyltransferase
MRFDIFTLFPDFFASPFESSILGRAQKSGALQLGVHDIRAWTTDKHHVCDDTPFGGGAGMVMKAEPVARAVEDVLKWDAVSLPKGSIAGAPPCPVILMSPQGRPFSQKSRAS